MDRDAESFLGACQTPLHTSYIPEALLLLHLPLDYSRPTSRYRHVKSRKAVVVSSFFFISTFNLSSSSKQATTAAATMNFELPQALVDRLAQLDSFIESEITPLQNENDNNRFFDHRREHARTDWDNGGLPREEWEQLLDECRRRADKAGFYRFSLPREYGGENEESGRGANLWMAVIREHLASKGLGLFNDLQNEHSIVGNFPDVVMVQHFGTPEQKEELIGGRLKGKVRITFGLTEPGHGSDATFMNTRGEKQADGSWLLNGAKMWQTGMHKATNCFIFARTSGKPGDANGITCFNVPRHTPGIKVESYEWTLNMPTDHATVSIKDVRVPNSSIIGPEGKGLAVAQAFVHENRIRQAASSLGAAVYCINESVKYARRRQPFGKPLAANQAIQFPLVELATQCEMLRLLIRSTAEAMDKIPHVEVEYKLGNKVSMCNYWANRLCCEAADRAIQVHGGWGYSRHCQFEHIWRHHRRYRITEGSEEIQMRKVAGYLVSPPSFELIPNILYLVGTLTDVPASRPSLVTWAPGKIWGRASCKVHQLCKQACSKLCNVYLPPAAFFSTECPSEASLSCAYLRLRRKDLFRGLRAPLETLDIVIFRIRFSHP
jgi:alkylation response protein AidB-like acyl-CoA dehydrogenase